MKIGHSHSQRWMDLLSGSRQGCCHSVHCKAGRLCQGVPGSCLLALGHDLVGSCALKSTVACKSARCVLKVASCARRSAAGALLLAWRGPPGEAARPGGLTLNSLARVGPARTAAAAHPADRRQPTGRGSPAGRRARGAGQVCGRQQLPHRPEAAAGAVGRASIGPLASLLAAAAPGAAHAAPLSRQQLRGRPAAAPVHGQLPGCGAPAEPGAHLRGRLQPAEPPQRCGPARRVQRLGAAAPAAAAAAAGAQLS